MDELHRRYAEEICVLGGFTDPRLKAALAKVRREEFLPPGPWVIETLEGHYVRSETAAISEILHGIGVALDPARALNNANPVKTLTQWQWAGIHLGETVFHVGAGTGYYSALLAELVGPTGKVYAAEIDPALYRFAEGAVRAWGNIVLLGDATQAEIPPIDLLYSSAGIGDLPEAWLDAVKPGGRMVVPLTDAQNHGAIFLLRRSPEGDSWSASARSFTRHFPCAGTRDDQALSRLKGAWARPVSQVTSLRRDRHPQDPSCWCHQSRWCLSALGCLSALATKDADRP